MFRLLGLLGGLSVVTDLGVGAPLEEALRRCLVAARLASAVGCSRSEISDVIYTALLQHLGCTAYAHEAARIWGDDIASTRIAFLTDFTHPRDIWRTWVPGVAEATNRSPARVAATTLAMGRKVNAEGPPATCDVARSASRQLGLPDVVQDSLFHTLAMWNGKGYPRTAGEAIPVPARLMQVASAAVMVAERGGAKAAAAEVRRRSGSHLDPQFAEALAARSVELLDGLADVDAYQCVLDAEPDPVRLVDDTEVETVARTFGHLADLKSPWLHGHSGAVAALATDAASGLRLGMEARTLRLAGYLHDLGRVGVSSRIWDKPGPLSVTERDQARLHAYHSERIIARVPALSDVASLAGQHHERCDGSGYHRGLAAAQLSLTSRILAAADAFQTLVEGRPHHPALTAAQAADRLTGAARSGRLDADAVAAVLHAAGMPRGSRTARPAGLTERQVEVLRLLARGLSNRDIARRLVISNRTAEHHVQDVYVKIGTATRAGAALFAMEHGLVGPLSTDG